MGKTYKSSRGRYYRRPKGYKRARINNCRSIPPDGWCWEVDHCRSNYTPWRAAGYMFNEGWPEYEILERLQKKFQLTLYQAEEIVEYYFPSERPRFGWRAKPEPDNRTPEGYLKIWHQKEIKPKKKKY